ncbi:MAG: DUF1566 domain-containing protein [Leptospiraceae bacterium]|nr:DUF1566 domain-containing protein [Leptospiraceae bacterium]
MTDSITGLIWQKCGLGRNNDSSCSDDTGVADITSWQSAIDYCNNLNLGSITNWRLPNRNELQSIVDYTTDSPAIDTTAFPATASTYYWSSTTKSSFTGTAWYVDFDEGKIYQGFKTSSYDVRCVSGP